MARIVVIHEEGVVESAGDDQPRKGAQPGEPALAFILVQAGMAKARGRVPADRPALVLAIGDVERAVDEDGEAQPGPGPKFEHADAALDPVAQGPPANARELRQRAPLRGDVPAGTEEEQ